MSIAYFAHELADPAVQKRVRMLMAGGRTVALLGFERQRFAGAHAAPAHVLGHTRNAALLARILVVLAAIPRAWKLRAVWAKADALLARNLEMLAIVILLQRLSGSRAPVIYECLDIHRLMLSRGAAGMVLRALERVCLRRVALVLTSSPAFDKQYFHAIQHYRGETRIVENKVLALSEAPPARAAAPEAGPRWKIAWCGVLRCAKSFEMLRALAEAAPDLVEIDMWGAPALDQIPDFHARATELANFAYRGRYNPEDLPNLYARAHFVWAIDYYEQGGNSDWLLPNRLYEGLYFGAIPIAASGVETARWLERKQVGVIIDEPIEQGLQAFLSGMTPDSYASLRAATARLDPRTVCFSLEDCRALSDVLVGGGKATP